MFLSFHAKQGKCNWSEVIGLSRPCDFWDSHSVGKLPNIRYMAGIDKDLAKRYVLKSLSCLAW